MLSRLFGTRGGWWLLASVLALSSAAVAALTVEGEWAGALAGGFAALTILSFTWALQLLVQVGAERERLKQATALADAREAEVRHLAGARLPAISARVRAGQRLDGVPGPLTSPAATGEEFDRALNSVVVALGSDVAVRRERALRDSVQAAFESVARNMHAMATVQLRVLDNVEKIISDPRLMSEVMRADHAAAQMTRKAQTLLVMCGIWPAKRESRPVSLYDCVRGAQSRIVEFGRVEVHGGQSLHVIPPAVEGLMHSIAELLENATVFSPSNTQVVVTMREVGAGAVIEIDDAGLGMPPDTLHQALGQLRDDVDLAQLGAVPRLGLACVGRWARELGINVELTGASAYGGTRVVVFVPHRLLTEPVAAQPQRDEMPREASPAAPPSPYGGRAPSAAPEPAPARPSAELGGARAGFDDSRPDQPARSHGTPRHAAPPSSAMSGPPPWSSTERPSAVAPAPQGDTPQTDSPEAGTPSTTGSDAAPERAPAPNLPVRQRAQRSAPLPPPASPTTAPPGPPVHSAPQAQTSHPPQSGSTESEPEELSASGLPKRRSRRRPPGSQDEHHAPGQPPPLTQPFEAFGTNRKPPDESLWTPEAARASVASVLSGTRRGRAELAEAPEPEPSPRTSPPPPPDTSHDPYGDRP